MEQWKQVEGYEDVYEISDHGKVRRVKSGRILKSYPDKNGYYLVRFSKNNVGKTVRLAGLVARHFLPNPKNLPQVNHKEGRHKWDNSVGNLEWMTSQGNIKHACENGLRVPSEKHPSAKLTWKIVDEIRERHVMYNKCRGNGRALAEEFGVSPNAVSSILRGRTWKRGKLSDQTGIKVALVGDPSGTT